ncbi:MAG: hypothetical protein KA502_00565 [Candidatus Methanomethylophilaceae archaeon]|nr:hypothetical protein [Candidatus Methanomethylophilaceae archaeon]
MNKKVAIGAGVAALLLIVCMGSVFATDWDSHMKYNEPQNIPFTDVVDETDTLNPQSLNYNLFEKYGPVLLILAVLMFGAMIGGVCISREESDDDDPN